MLIGERLSQLRKEAQIKAEELGIFVGVKKRMVFLYEKNTAKPSFDVLVKIADYFGVSLDYLVGRSDDPRINEFRKKPSLNRTLSPEEKEDLLSAEEALCSVLSTKELISFHKLKEENPDNPLKIIEGSVRYALWRYSRYLYLGYIGEMDRNPQNLTKNIEVFAKKLVYYFEIAKSGNRPRSEGLLSKETKLLETLPASLLPAYNEAREKNKKNPENLQQIIDTFTKMAKDYYSLTK